MKPTYEELEAQVHMLRREIMEYEECDTSSQSLKAQKSMFAAARLTPKACLSEVKAKAGWSGFISGANWLWLNAVYLKLDVSEDDKVNAAKEYFEKIKKG